MKGTYFNIFALFILVFIAPIIIVCSSVVLCVFLPYFIISLFVTKKEVKKADYKTSPLFQIFKNQQKNVS